MKRIFTALLAAALVLALACPALAEAAQTFTTPYYTLEIPRDWQIDTSDLETDDDFQELGVLLSPDVPGLVIEAGLLHYEELSELSLWNADDETIQNYIDFMLEALEDDSPKYEKKLEIGEIPFFVFSAQDEDGPYCYVDTITNGYAVAFYVYNADTDDDRLLPLTDDDWAQFEAILSTFKPVG